MTKSLSTISRMLNAYAWVTLTFTDREMTYTAWRYAGVRRVKSKRA